MDLVFVAVRSLVVYLFIVLGIRLFGKREITQLSVIDLVFILLISNSVQSAMVGTNTSLIGGLVAAVVLFIVNMLLGNLVFKSSAVSKFIQGSPTLLIYHGRVLQKHLDSAKISREELEAVVREHGVESSAEVDLAVLEIDGNISVLSDDFTHRSSKKRHGHKVINKNT